MSLFGDFGMLMSSVSSDAVVCAIAGVADTTDGYYFSTDFLIDATGQSNGTSYTASEGPAATAITYNGAATITSEKFVFNGTDAYLRAADNKNWQPLIRWTLDVVNVRTTSTTSGAIIGHYSNAGGKLGWQIVVASNLVIFQISNDGNTSVSLGAIDLGAADTAADHDYTITYDGRKYRGYRDGQYMGAITANLDGTITSFDAASGLYVGATGNSGETGGQNFWNGSLTAVRMTRGVARYTHESGCGYRPKMPFAASQGTPTQSISFVGAKTYNYATGSTQSITFDSLTGGVDTEARIGDTIIIIMGGAVSSGGGSAPFLSSNGGFRNPLQGTPDAPTDTNSARMSVHLFDCTDGVPTGVVAGDPQGTGRGVGVIIAVLRGPVATVAQEAMFSAINTSVPNPAAVTPTVAGSWIIVASASAHSGGSLTYTSIPGLTNTVQTNSNSTYDVTVGLGMKTDWTSGSFDPAAWTGPRTANTADSVTCVTFTIVPKP